MEDMRASGTAGTQTDKQPSIPAQSQVLLPTIDPPAVQQAQVAKDLQVSMCQLVTDDELASTRLLHRHARQHTTARNPAHTPRSR